MVERKALLISRKNAFLCECAKQFLENDSFLFTVTTPEIDSVEEVRHGYRLFILICGDYIVNSIDLLVYLNDICTEHKSSLSLIVVGMKEEIDIVNQYIHSQLMVPLLRPIEPTAFGKFLDEWFAQRIDYVSRRNILIVDDDEMSASVTAGILKAKYNVETVCSGAEMFIFLAKHPCDLVLLDYKMPIADGPTVLKMLRMSQLRDTPVILLTGNANVNDMISVMECGISGYILKDNVSEVMQRVDDFFKKNRR